MGDILETVVGTGSNNTALDVCVLEEPEHCKWYRAPGDGWTKRFNYVVGIVHTSEYCTVLHTADESPLASFTLTHSLIFLLATDYKEYASAHYSGLWTAPAIALMSSAMVRAYCHKVINQYLEK